MWDYGVQLWRRTKKYNIKIIQTFRNKVLRSIVDVRNDDTHRDLKMPKATNEIKRFPAKYEQRLHKH